MRFPDESPNLVRTLPSKLSLPMCPSEFAHSRRAVVWRALAATDTLHTVYSSVKAPQYPTGDYARALIVSPRDVPTLTTLRAMPSASVAPDVSRVPTTTPVSMPTPTPSDILTCVLADALNAHSTGAFNDNVCALILSHRDVPALTTLMRATTTPTPSAVAPEVIRVPTMTSVAMPTPTPSDILTCVLAEALNAHSTGALFDGSVRSSPNTVPNISEDEPARHEVCPRVRDVEETRVFPPLPEDIHGAFLSFLLPTTRVDPNFPGAKKVTRPTVYQAVGAIKRLETTELRTSTLTTIPTHFYFPRPLSVPIQYPFFSPMVMKSVPLLGAPLPRVELKDLPHVQQLTDEIDLFPVRFFHRELLSKLLPNSIVRRNFKIKRSNKMLWLKSNIWEVGNIESVKQARERQFNRRVSVVTPLTANKEVYPKPTIWTITYPFWSPMASGTGMMLLAAPPQSLSAIESLKNVQWSYEPIDLSPVQHLMQHNGDKEDDLVQHIGDNANDFVQNNGDTESGILAFSDTAPQGQLDQEFAQCGADSFFSTIPDDGDTSNDGDFNAPPRSEADETKEVLAGVHSGGGATSSEPQCEAQVAPSGQGVSVYATVVTILLITVTTYTIVLARRVSAMREQQRQLTRQAVLRRMAIGHLRLRVAKEKRKSLHFSLMQVSERCLSFFA